MKNFYRLRSIERAIQEIEEETLYFALPEELNDPMEGFRYIYWSGDSIVWKNFFRHYLFCLERICFLLILSNQKFTITSCHIPILCDINNHPSEKNKELFNKIAQDLFDNDTIEYIDKISKRPKIYRDELFSYLNNITAIAIHKIINTYKTAGIFNNKIAEIPVPIVPIFSHSSFIDNLEALNDNEVKILLGINKSMLEQMHILNNYNSNYNNKTKNDYFLLDFTREYLKAIEKLIYPDWGAVCFMSECKNSSAWGHYAANHTGICMIFNIETNGEKSYIDLYGNTGYTLAGNPSISKTTKGYKKFEFYKINYLKQFGEIDFFRSLGTLNIPTLMSTWYTNEQGEESICANHITKSQESWHTNHWNDFIRDITVKSTDWEYEKEHRLILTSVVFDIKQKENRILKYNFNSLAGIIFGINTRLEDKLKIMNAIDRKCAAVDNNNFKFYQAFYAHSEGIIDYRELSLLKVSSEATK